MADIPDNDQPIQIEGARTRKPVSESLVQQIGGAINYILKKGFRVSEFTSSQVWQVPPDVENCIIVACGGGGGGGGGGQGGTSGQLGGQGGGGGFGAKVVTEVFPVVPGEFLNITVGAAGLGGSGATSAPGSLASNGTAGGTTTVTGTFVDMILPGGSPGLAGVDGHNIEYSWVANGATSYTLAVTAQEQGNPGGNGGTYFAAGSPAPFRSIRVNAAAAGGAAQPSPSGFRPGSGGGGGGSGLKVGGAGGAAGGSGQGPGSPGATPAADAYGAAGGGGGGGGGNGTSGSRGPGGAGGNGISGVVRIYYV